jgi:CRISPR type III-A-associated RAMP protein Csm4
MNPGLVVKLRPTGPWRIGPDSGARNRVDTIYHSDTLYAAVTGALARLGPLEDWLDATARNGVPSVCFSSCYPFVEEIGFIVPPRTIWPPTSPALLSARVRWKSARFVPLGIVQAILAGRTLDENHWSVDAASECLVPAGRPGPFRTGMRSNAAVDRLTGSAERHSTACIEFRAGAGLWTVVSFADDAAAARWLHPVKTAFRLLADSGFGGERSRGWGRSEAPEFIHGMLPEMILPAIQVEEPEAAALEPQPQESPEEPPREAAVLAPVAILPLSVESAEAELARISAASEAIAEAEPVAAPEVAAGTAIAPPGPDSEPPAPAAPVPAADSESSAAAAEPVQAESAPVTPESEHPPAVATEGPAPEPASAEAAPVTPPPESSPTAATPASETEPASAEAAPVMPPLESSPTAATPASGTEPASPEAAPVTLPQESSTVAATPAPGTDPVSAESVPVVPSPESSPTAATPASETEPASAEAAPVTPPLESSPTAAMPASGTEPESAESAPATPAPEPSPTASPAPEPEPLPPAAAIITPKPTPGFAGTPEGAAPAVTSGTHPHWLLSLFTPAPSDSVDWSRGSYSVIVRGGRIESPVRSGERKKQLPMVAEGSVLYAAGLPAGSAPDVAPDGFAHPVYRAGFALSIPLPEVS